MLRLSTAKYGQLRLNYSNSTSIQSKLSVTIFEQVLNINTSLGKLFVGSTAIISFNYGYLRSSMINTFQYGLLRSTTVKPHYGVL